MLNTECKNRKDRLPMTQNSRDCILILQDESLDVSNSSVSGNLFWKFGDLYFPEVDWYDLPCSLLAMWTDSLSKMVRSRNGKATLDFMDGPFYLHVQKCQDVLAVELYEDTTTKPVLVAAFETDTMAFCKEVYNAAQGLLEYLKIHFKTNDLEKFCRSQLGNEHHKKKADPIGFLYDVAEIIRNCEILQHALER